MPLPRIAAKISTRVISPFTRHLSGRLPGFATVEHRGRSTGRRYRSPVNVFVRDGRAVFALTYGRDAQWVRNVMAAGECAIETRRRPLKLIEPEIVTDPDRQLVSPLARLALAIMRVDDFLVMRIIEDGQ